MSLKLQFIRRSTRIDSSEESASSDNSDSFSSYAPEVRPSDPPGPSVEGNIGDTAPRNIASKERIAQWIRQNVYAVSPDLMRCILSLVELLAENPTDVELCHAIEAAIKRKLIRTLEFYLGLPAGTLNVNSRYNVFLLRADLHIWYDHGGIVFVPAEDDVLDAILQLVQHNRSCLADLEKRISFKKVEILNRKRYKYRLVVLHMEANSRVISRQQLVNGKDTGTATIHLYPFRDECFQNIESHLNPCFALAHACHQINKGLANEKYTSDDLKQKPELERVLEIIEGWQDYEVIPKEFLNAKPAAVKPPKPTPDPTGSGSARLKKGGSLRPMGSASRAAGKAPSKSMLEPTTKLHFEIEVPTSEALALSGNQNLRRALSTLLSKDDLDVRVTNVGNQDHTAIRTGVTTRASSRGGGSASASVSRAGSISGLRRQTAAAKEGTTTNELPLPKKNKQHIRDSGSRSPRKRGLEELDDDPFV